MVETSIPVDSTLFFEDFLLMYLPETSEFQDISRIVKSEINKLQKLFSSDQIKIYE